MNGCDEGSDRLTAPAAVDTRSNQRDETRASEYLKLEGSLSISVSITAIVKAFREDIYSHDRVTSTGLSSVGMKDLGLACEWVSRNLRCVRVVSVLYER